MDGRKRNLFNEKNVWRVYVSARKYSNMIREIYAAESIAIQYIYIHHYKVNAEQLFSRQTLFMQQST
jgi:hypothetical protein